MDIQIASNFERLIYDFIGPEKTKKLFSNITKKDNDFLIEEEIHKKITTSF